MFYAQHKLKIIFKKYLANFLHFGQALVKNGSDCWNIMIRIGKIGHYCCLRNERLFQRVPDSIPSSIPPPERVPLI